MLRSLGFPLGAMAVTPRVRVLALGLRVPWFHPLLTPTPSPRVAHALQGRFCLRAELMCSARLGSVLWVIRVVLSSIWAALRSRSTRLSTISIRRPATWQLIALRLTSPGLHASNITRRTVAGREAGDCLVPLIGPWYRCAPVRHASATSFHLGALGRSGLPLLG